MNGTELNVGEHTKKGRPERNRKVWVSSGVRYGVFDADSFALSLFDESVRFDSLFRCLLAAKTKGRKTLETKRLDNTDWAATQKSPKHAAIRSHIPLATHYRGCPYGRRGGLPSADFFVEF